MSKLIIIRGNSGSGKSTTALNLQHELGHNTMLIQQDVVRRDMLNIKGDDPENPTVQLIANLAEYGKSIGFPVIIEGILQNSTNQTMLLEVVKAFDEVYVYYFDISFEETLRRHASKPNSHEFGEEKMREWWREKDYLGLASEVTITDSMSESEIMSLILSDIR